jgi:hypothetical protein
MAAIASHERFLFNVPSMKKKVYIDAVCHAIDGVDPSSALPPADAPIDAILRDMHAPGFQPRAPSIVSQLVRNALRGDLTHIETITAEYALLLGNMFEARVAPLGARATQKKEEAAGGDEMAMELAKQAHENWIRMGAGIAAMRGLYRHILAWEQRRAAPTDVIPAQPPATKEVACVTQTREADASGVIGCARLPGL